jgi:signal transduction histidine kinase
MKTDMTDKELIAELQARLASHKQYQAEQERLIRELTQVNEKLKLSEKCKTDFLSNIRNELTNPLTSVLGFSKSMQQGIIPPDLLKRIATDIHGELSLLDFQFRNIFAAADIEAGECPLENMAVNIDTLLQGTVDLCAHKVKKKDILLNLSGANQNAFEDVIFITDPSKLQLILLNLIANAIEFSAPGNEVKVTYTIENAQLEIVVQDHGIGVKPSDQQLIFDRFLQLEKGMTKSYRGHGLGLSVTKAYVELLNGTIDIESDGQNGSTFKITIPELDTAPADGFASDGNEFFFLNADRF